MTDLTNLSGEELLNAIKRITEFGEDSPGGYKLPTGLLENLGLTPVNTERGMKATNVQKGEMLGDFEFGHDFGECPSEESRKKRLSFLKEKARALALEEKFYEACSLLEDVTDKGNSADLGTKLLMTECYLQLGRENRANKCLGCIEKTLKSDPLLPANDLISMADDFLASTSYVRAMIILNIAADIFLNSSANPEEILAGVFRCCSKLDDVLKAMLNDGGRNTTIAADMGLENLVEMSQKLGKIKNCNRDHQVVKEALCCRFLDHDYSLLDDHKKCIKYGNLGVAKMEEHFTPLGAQRYRIYGGQLHNCAITLGNVQRFDEAAAVYQKAIEAKENAVDYENDLVRNADIEKAKRDLKQLRAVMG